MKFGANLQTIQTPEWRSQYLEYEMLKETIYRYQEILVSKEGLEEEYQRELTRIEERFFVKCDAELSKVNNFYAEKLAEATRRFAFLQNELEAHKDILLIQTIPNNNDLSISNRPSIMTQTPGTISNKKTSNEWPKLFFKQREKVRLKTMKEIKFAFTEFYLSLVLLQNYQELNFTGFRKILKKHDKVFKTERGAKWRVKYVEVSPFYTDNIISDYIKKTEDTYINHLEGGDRTRAMKRLRVPPLTGTVTHPKGTVFRVGLFLGMSIVLFFVFVIAYHYVPKHDGDLLEIVKLYRSGLIGSIFFFYLGLNVKGWKKCGVNHVLIFEIDPRQHLSHQHFFEIAALVLFVWCFSVVAYVLGRVEVVEKIVPYSYNPGVMYLFFVIFLLNPIPMFYHKSRFWLIKILWRLVACGFYPVAFADFWLADQLNSLAVLLLDTQFIICYYSNLLGSDESIMIEHVGEKCSPFSYALFAVIASYPAYIRFVQCLRRYKDSKKAFPHLVNAGKYSTSFFKNTFRALHAFYLTQSEVETSVYFYLWFACCFISSCYTFSWDIKMDWGFLEASAPKENKYLREEIIYSEKIYYYGAIVIDFILRFFWIVIYAIKHIYGDPAGIILENIAIFLEVTRRFIWNFFRLENEHLNNIGEFRAVRDISITPFRKDDHQQVENIVDDIDGAENYLIDPITRYSTLNVKQTSVVPMAVVKRKSVQSSNFEQPDLGNSSSIDDSAV